MELAPKESKKVKAVLDWKRFAEYDAQGNLHLRPQTIQVQIGASFADIRLQADIKTIFKKLKEGVTILQHSLFRTIKRAV